MEKIRQDEEIWKVKNRLGKKVKKELHGRKAKRQDEVRSIGSRVESTKAKPIRLRGIMVLVNACLGCSGEKKSLQYKNVSGWKDLRHGLPRVRALLANLWYELWSWKKKKKKNRNCQKWRENIQKTLSTLTPLRDSNSSLGWKGCTLILFCLKVWK